MLIYMYLYLIYILILQIYRNPQFSSTKIKTSKIQVQNKTQTLGKSGTFLSIA